MMMQQGFLLLALVCLVSGRGVHMGGASPMQHVKASAAKAALRAHAAAQHAAGLHVDFEEQSKDISSLAEDGPGGGPASDHPAFIEDAAYVEDDQDDDTRHLEEQKQAEFAEYERAASHTKLPAADALSDANESESNAIPGANPLALSAIEEAALKDFLRPEKPWNVIDATIDKEILDMELAEKAAVGGPDVDQRTKVIEEYDWSADPETPEDAELKREHADQVAAAAKLQEAKLANIEAKIEEAKLWSADPDHLQEEVESKLQEVLGLAGDAYQSAKDAASDALHSAKGAVADKLNEAKDAFDNINNPSYDHVDDTQHEAQAAAAVYSDNAKTDHDDAESAASRPKVHALDSRPGKSKPRKAKGAAKKAKNAAEAAKKAGSQMNGPKATVKEDVEPSGSEAQQVAPVADSSTEQAPDVSGGLVAFVLRFAKVAAACLGVAGLVKLLWGFRERRNRMLKESSGESFDAQNGVKSTRDLFTDGLFGPWHRIPSRFSSAY
eukprot:TRINITY_DN803_c1_g1_i2.p1 TRINITY_DN803_c1_g1~~TRINITY_DN803_c1_g1_i2.p1  ORF type:complete len:536 (-),score=142.33 TRINITY_DN803_c1_g1_i2:340-1833(-)